MIYKDLTIIIQGPPNKITLFEICNYLKYGKLILSYNQNENVPEYLKHFNGEKLKIITYKDEDISFYYNYPKNNPICLKHFAKNVIRQIYSTKIALDLVDTDYCIKTRSDEYYENLDYFISAIRSNKNYIFCNNIFFNSFQRDRYHMSDHIYGTNTKNLKRTFEIFWNLIKDNKISNLPIENYNKNCFHSEQGLAISFMHALAEDLKIDINQNNFENFFKIIDFAFFGNYRIASNSNPDKRQPRFYINNFNLIDKNRSKNHDFSIKEKLL
jgi:hypothetical protein